MAMHPFELIKVDTVSGALRALSEYPSAKLIGGGTNLVDLMKLHVERPQVLIDMTKLPLAQITLQDDGALWVGALVRNSDLARDANVAKSWPLLQAALLSGASPQLRNMATAGGNLLQRTRCSYFQDSASPCNKRVAAQGCAARSGHHRYHAIFGASEECIAVHPSDLCVALAALEAVVVVEGPGGERRIAFENFHTLPGSEPWRDSVLGRDEIITGIVLPPDHFNSFDYLKLRDRRSYAFALLSVACMLDIDDGNILSARISMGGVAHKPWRNLAAEASLVGKESTHSAFVEAAEQFMTGAEPLRDNAFKIGLGKMAIMRSLARAAALESRHIDPTLAHRAVA
jgi:xanthine dehydrogenase YagS FAD-binding subunit